MDTSLCHIFFPLVPEPRSRYLQCANETIRESEWIGASECALMLTEQFFSFIIKISCFCIPLLCELPGLEPDFFWLKFPNESCSNDPYLEHILSFFKLEPIKSEAMNMFIYSKYRIKQLLSFDSVNVWINWHL
jgi:hypothetical protein